MIKQFSYVLLAIVGFVPHVYSNMNTVALNWDITCVNASPDGFSRPVIGVNGQWPCPPINVKLGDRLIINVNNKLGNESTSIHFHGLFQAGTAAMDGPVGVTQCPILPGQNFQYDFVVNQVGTYWYHSHNGGSYMDGFRGAFLVHDPSPPFTYDEELAITLSDWYHDQAPELVHYYQSTANEDAGGAEPIPKSALMQDTQNANFALKPKKTYLLRIINTGSFVGSYFQIDGQDMTVVEVDGVYTQKQKVDQLYLTVAQPYSILVESKDNNEKNFAIRATLDQELFDKVPPGQTWDVFGFLVYDSKKPLPTPEPIKVLKPYDDFQLVPQDRQLAYTKVDRQIILTMDFTNDTGINRATINGISYVPQKVPTLYTALSAPKNVVSNPLIYGLNTNSHVVNSSEVVEIVLINNDAGHHPWHPSAIRPPHTPIRRDTVQVHSQGYLVLRYKADNPGVQLFHCHIEFHVEAGLTATIIEAPDKLQDLETIPLGHIKTCQEQGIPTRGNAAGNTKDWLDMTGANTKFNTDNWGALIVKPGKRLLRFAV